MPLYDYRCEKCGEVTEVRHRYDEPGPSECPHCGGTLTKLISAPSLQFKGSGFYITDYGRAGQTKQTESTASPKESKSEPAKESASAKESPPAKESPSAKESTSVKESSPAPVKSTDTPKST
jgi:putative FmdB family regulatory protein